MNVRLMLCCVYNWMVYLNLYYWLGVVMVVYCMYLVLRENGVIVDCYIFEIFFFCIKSLKFGELDDE